MSPPSSRSGARKQRNLWISLILVVCIAFGWLGLVIVSGWHPLLGLDLNGGLSVVYKPATHASQDQLNETVDIMTSRVNALGVSGATVGTQGNDIVVSVPGIKNPNTVLKFIGSTGQLYFRPALCYAPPYTPAAATPAKGKQKAVPAKSPGPLPTTCPGSGTTPGTDYQLVTQNLSGSSSSSTGVQYNIGADPGLAPYPTTAPGNDNYSDTVLLPGLPSSGSTIRYLLGPGEMKGSAVKPGSAIAQLDQSGQWVVTLGLTSAGSAQWDAMSKKYFHEIIGIELDGIVQSAPITQPTQAAWSSFGGSVQISGSFDQQTAQALADAVNYGALPVRLVQQTYETVSPTLGKSSLKAGLAAGLAGLILVLLYVILYYRALGLVVVSGLIVTGALLWAIISTLGHTQNLTLDLAGVTGLIVSIGITVDSYIVFFERLKDETRAGRTIRSSVDRGFKSAWRTVFAADLVSLIGAVLLWLIAIGEVKGFAFFLGLSTLLDLLITYFYTRPLVILLSRNQKVTEAKAIGISEGLAVSVGADA
jgi:preprotein translocase subunit SecD